MVLLTALLQNLAAFLHRVASVPLMVDGLENDYSSTSSCGSHGSDFKEDNITKNDNITKEDEFKENDFKVKAIITKVVETPQAHSNANGGADVAKHDAGAFVMA